jgi:hypothetical protein
MNRRITLGLLPAVCLLLLAASVATAAEDLLKLVPDSALGFVVLNRPAAVDAKLQALGRHMQLPVPGLWAMLKQQSGIQAGCDENGSIALLVLPPEGDSAWPTPILLVPVTDYAKFVGQLQAEDASQPVTKIMVFQREFLVRSIGGYAAIADAKYRAVLEKTLHVSPQVAAVLTPWQKWSKGNDFSGVILPSGLQRLWAKAREGLRIGRTMMAAQADEKVKAMAGVFEMYETMLQAAEGEVAASGSAVQLDRQNVLRLTSRTLLKPGGKWARLAGQCQPSKENLLAGLPCQPFVVAGGGVVSAAAWEAMFKLSIDVIKSSPNLYGIGPEQSQKLTKWTMDSMKEIRAISMVLGADQHGGALFSNTTGVMRVDHAAAYMAAYEKDLQKYVEMLKGLHSPMLQPATFEKCEVGGTPALQLTMKAPKPLAGPQMAQQAQMMKLMFGPSGELVAWIAPADEHHVVMGYAKKAVEQTLEAIRQGKPGLAGDAAVTKTAALLPSGPLAALYWSPKGTIGFVQQIVRAVAPPQVKVPLKLPEFPQTPPLGFAVTTAANELQTCLVVPAEVLQAIGPYVGQILAMRARASHEQN